MVLVANQIGRASKNKASHIMHSQLYKKWKISGLFEIDRNYTYI